MLCHSDWLVVTGDFQGP